MLRFLIFAALLACLHASLAVSQETLKSQLDELRLKVENNTALARKAEADAQAEKARTDAALIIAKGSGYNTLILQIFGLAGIGMLPLVQYWIAKRTRAEAQLASNVVLGKLSQFHATAEETRLSMRKLETNNNNKLDQLLSVTSDACRFAEPEPLKKGLYEIPIAHSEPCSATDADYPSD